MWLMVLATTKTGLWVYLLVCTAHFSLSATWFSPSATHFWSSATHFSLHATKFTLSATKFSPSATHFTLSSTQVVPSATQFYSLRHTLLYLRHNQSFSQFNHHICSVRRSISILLHMVYLTQIIFVQNARHMVQPFRIFTRYEWDHGLIRQCFKLGIIWWTKDQTKHINPARRTSKDFSRATVVWAPVISA